MAIPRSVGRIHPAAALLAGLTALAGLLGAMASPGGADPGPDPSPDLGLHRVGMNSCAARGCHGAVEATDPAGGRVYIKDGAYTTWLNYDPHARAYAVLLEPRSVAIAAKLNANRPGPALGGRPAHESALCLSCHATVGPPEPARPEAALLRDGITCESCHGPAEVWQGKHLDPAWRGLAAYAKEKDGLTDLSTPAARAKNCVGCHVGDRSRGMDMNHDLIAAGHPRLNFEFSAYQASYPKHWREAHETSPSGASGPAASGDFEAKSWAVGQVVTARAGLELLAARALGSKEGATRKPPSPDAIWPEFSEYECFACHHDLVNPSPLQVAGRPNGQLPWATWASAMLPDLAQVAPGAVDPGPVAAAWAAIDAEMRRKVPDPDEVARRAADGIKQLDLLLRGLETGSYDPSKVASLLKGLAGRPTDLRGGWDRLAQRDLALSALARSARGFGLAVDPEAEKALRAASAALEFPPDYDSPKNTSSLSAPAPKPGP